MISVESLRWLAATGREAAPALVSAESQESLSAATRSPRRARASARIRQQIRDAAHPRRFSASDLLPPPQATRRTAAEPAADGEGGRGVTGTPPAPAAGSTRSPARQTRGRAGRAGRPPTAQPRERGTERWPQERRRGEQTLAARPTAGARCASTSAGRRAPRATRSSRARIASRKEPGEGRAEDAWIHLFPHNAPIEIGPGSMARLGRDGGRERRRWSKPCDSGSARGDRARGRRRTHTDRANENARRCVPGMSRRVHFRGRPPAMPPRGDSDARHDRARGLGSPRAGRRARPSLPARSRTGPLDRRSRNARRAMRFRGRGAGTVSRSVELAGCTRVVARVSAGAGSDADGRREASSELEGRTGGSGREGRGGEREGVGKADGETCRGRCGKEEWTGPIGWAFAAGLQGGHRAFGAEGELEGEEARGRRRGTGQGERAREGAAGSRAREYAKARHGAGQRRERKGAGSRRGNGTFRSDTGQRRRW